MLIFSIKVFDGDLKSVPFLWKWFVEQGFSENVSLSLQSDSQNTRVHVRIQRNTLHTLIEKNR